MPQDCNGIELLDKTKHFCKLNCKWSYNPRGRRYKKGKPQIDQKEKRAKIKEPAIVYLTLEKSHLQYIRKAATQKSQATGRYVNANDLIRKALAEAFPAPEQFDMFGKKNKKESRN